MQQLEIEYFFPLTEQIPLDLDFKPCKEYEDEKRRQWLADSIASSGQFLVAGTGITGTTWATLATDNSFNSMPEGSVGYWAISSNTKLHRKERPNWLHQKMTKMFFGWEWNDK